MFPLLVLFSAMVRREESRVITAISAKSAQSDPKKVDSKFALFAVCTHAILVQNIANNQFLIKNHSNLNDLPTDILRICSQKSVESLIKNLSL